MQLEMLNQLVNLEDYLYHVLFQLEQSLLRMDFVQPELMFEH